MRFIVTRREFEEVRTILSQIVSTQERRIGVVLSDEEVFERGFNSTLFHEFRYELNEQDAEQLLAKMPQTWSIHPDASCPWVKCGSDRLVGMDPEEGFPVYAVPPRIFLKGLHTNDPWRSPVSANTLACYLTPEDWEVEIDDRCQFVQNIKTWLDRYGIWSTQGKVFLFSFILMYIMIAAVMCCA